MVERQSRWRWLRAVGGGVGAAALATGVLVSTAGVAHASTAAPTSSSSQGASAVLPVQQVATTNVGQLAQQDAPLRAAGPAGVLPHQQAPLGLPPGRRGVSGPATPGAVAPATPGAVVTTAPISTTQVSGETGFTGVTARENAAVNPAIGNVSPPDQGLAVGPSPSGTAIAEFVNESLSFYRPNGQTLLGTIPAYQLFGLKATAFLSDPRAYWDPATQHWFFTMFTIGTKKDSTSTQYLAVSKSTDPFGGYAIFAINTTDTGQPNCPCFGDFDQIGADANGFYISTNEFSETGINYNGAVIYAISKTKLINAATGLGATLTTVMYRVPTDSFGQTYHLSPASTPQYGTAPGTEYFVESNGDVKTANQLAVYALTDTASLTTGGTPKLKRTVVTVAPYSPPPNATQKTGPIPLGNADGQSEAKLRTDFDAVQSVTFTGGNLYAEYSTGVASTPTQTGAAWAVLKPSVAGTSLTASVVNQGVLTSSANLLYPNIDVASNGTGYMSFAMAGTAMFPSQGYVAFDATTGVTGPIHVAAQGAAPVDDFTCYSPFGPPCRYGDYSMGVAYGKNPVIYMAGEYVGAVPRDRTANWDTFITTAPADTDLALSTPADVSVKATGTSGATVAYPLPTVTDEDATAPIPACSPSSGATFSVGTTTVTCSVTDADDTPATVSTSFTVTVTPTAPAAPTGLRAVGGSGTVVLTWTAPTDRGGAPGLMYQVFRGTAPGKLSTTPLDTGLTGTTYTDAQVAAGHTYYYEVVATNSVGASPASDEAAVSLPATAASSSSPGYDLVAADGGIFTFGSASFSGSMDAKHLNAPIVGMAAAPTGKGYWEVAADGGIFAFGSAQFYGSEGGKSLNQPIVGMAAAPTGKGYWEVAADGGIFAFGAVPFEGSEGGQHLNAPMVGMAAAPTGKGYWEVAADGGIFTFGSASFSGSMGGQHLNAPMVGMAAAPTGKGYWEVAADGGIFTFGAVPFEGSEGGQLAATSVVGMAAT